MSIYDLIAQGGKVADIGGALGRGVKLADMFRDNRIGNATEQDQIEAIRLKNLQAQYEMENGGDGGAQFAASNGVLYNNRTGEYIVLPQEEKQYAPQSPYSIEAGYRLNKITGEYEKLPETEGSKEGGMYGQPYVALDENGNKVWVVMSKNGPVDFQGNKINTKILSMSPTQYDPSVVSDKAQATKEGENAGEQAVSNAKMESPIKEAKKLLGWDESKGAWGAEPKLTSSALGAARDASQKLYGGTSEAGTNAAALETVAGWMTASVPRMQGPQSDADRIYYEKMAAQLGDRTAPIPVRRKALDALISIREKYNTEQPNNPQNGKTVARTGTLPDGRKVIVYSDGTQEVR